MKKMYLIPFLLCIMFALTSCVQSIGPSKSPNGKENKPVSATTDDTQAMTTDKNEVLFCTDMPETSYVNATTNEAFALCDRVGYIGKYDNDENKLVINTIFAYSIEGNKLKRYDLVDPYWAADFANCTEEYDIVYDAESLIPSQPVKIGEYSKIIPANITLNEELEITNEAISFEKRITMLENGLANDIQPLQNFIPTEIVTEIEPIASSDKIERGEYYARSTLNEQDKIIYDALYDSISIMAETIDVSMYNLSNERIESLLNFIYTDSPEFFYLNKGYKYLSSGTIVQSIKVDYSYTADEVVALNEQVKVQAARILNNIDESMSEYQAAEYLYDYIMHNVYYSDVTYETLRPADESIIGGLIEHEAVCGGICKTYQYLLYQVGIQSYTVEGSVANEYDESQIALHSWNTVKIGNDWFYTNLTSDLVMRGDVLRSSPDYILLNQEDLESDGYIANEFNPTLPACNSEVYSSAEIEGRYFEKWDSKSINQFENVLYNALKEKEYQFDIVFSDQDNLEAGLQQIYCQLQDIISDIPAYQTTTLENIKITIPKYNDYFHLTIRLGLNNKTA